jgi:hypothetical protein
MERVYSVPHPDTAAVAHGQFLFALLAALGHGIFL